VRPLSATAGTGVRWYWALRLRSLRMPGRLAPGNHHLGATLRLLHPPNNRCASIIPDVLRKRALTFALIARGPRLARVS
jgi:hypothetical protein